MQNNPLLATPMPPTLVLDAFFDGIGSGGGRIKDACSTPDASKYHDPSTQHTVTFGGSTLSSKMPMGHQGARGVVIPRATRGGRSQGWNPHKQPHRRVIVDPIISGGALEMDLSLITKAGAAAAIQASHRLVPDATSIEQERLQQAAFFHVLAEQGAGRALNSQRDMVGAMKDDGCAPGVTVATTPLLPEAADPGGSIAAAVQAMHHPNGSVSQEPQPTPGPYQYKAASFDPTPPPAPIQYVQDVPQPPPYVAPSHDPALQAYTTGTPEQYQQHQQYLQQAQPPPYPPGGPYPAHVPAQHQPGQLLQAFRQPQHPPGGVYPATTAAASPSTAPPPHVRVILDTPQGEYDCYFHGTSREEATLALIFDNGYRGPKFMPRILTAPPAAGPQEPFAVHVDGSGVVFLVESTGMKYEYQGSTHYILLITHEQAYDARR